jgi:amidase
VVRPKQCQHENTADVQVTPHPPIIRGLRHVVEALKRAGHTVVDWQGPLGGKETQELMDLFWSADGGEEGQSDTAAASD